MMRRILVDHARATRAQKRGGDAQRCSLDEAMPGAGSPTTSTCVALDEALEALAAVDPQKARIVELRFFGGLSLDETATCSDLAGDRQAALRRRASSGCTGSWGGTAGSPRA